MENDNRIYRKAGKRYVPVGVSYTGHYLTDGIYLVRSTNHSVETSNLKYYAGICRVGDVPVLDFTRIAAAVSEAGPIAEIIAGGGTPYERAVKILDYLASKADGQNQNHI